MQDAEIVTMEDLGLKVGLGQGDLIDAYLAVQKLLDTKDFRDC